MKVQHKQTLYAILFVVFSLLILGGFVIRALPNTVLPVRDEGYNIDNYVMEINVSKENVLSIQETIDVSFISLLKHGIYRNMPLYQQVKFTNDEGALITKNHKLSYSNIKVSSHKFEDVSTSKEVVLRLGSEFRTVNSTETYKISYQVDLGDDRIDEMDMFYFNLLGEGWTAPIANFVANVTFEKPLGQTAAKIYFGNQTYDAIINASSFSVHFSDIGCFTPITAFAKLDADYFAHKRDILMPIAVLAMLLLFVIIALIVFNKYSNKNEPVPVVQIEMPKKYSSAEVGYIIDKKIENRDVSSLIVSWASLGFIKIIENKKSITIEKLAECMGRSQSETSLFNSFFASGNTYFLNTKNAAMYLKIEAFKSSIKSKTQSLFSAKAEMFRTILCGMFAFILAAVFLLFGIRNESYFVASKLLALFFFGASFSGVSLMMHTKDAKETGKPLSLFFAVLIPSCVILGVFIVFYCTSFDYYLDRFLVSILVPLFACIIAIVASKMNLHTDVGNRTIGEILGLKLFIEAAEKDRIEMLAKENPNIFYEILPFAFVLGVSDVWIKKFEKIKVLKPSWLASDESYNYFIGYRLGAIMERSNVSFDNYSKEYFALIAAKAAKSVGGSGRSGGFSGGGFGGGGGGSW